MEGEVENAPSLSMTANGGRSWFWRMGGSEIT